MIGWNKRLRLVGHRLVSKNYNPNRAKIHRSYTVEEAANLFEVHKNTVRAWINEHGLKTNDSLRPVLILGRDLRQFMQAKRTKNKHKCLPNEVYCLKCRKPQVPAGHMADYMAMTDTMGRLIGICPDCGNLINKFFSLSKIQTIKKKLAVTIQEGTKTHNQED